LIGGLIIGNGEQPVIVVRAIGPTLGSSGITQPLQDPTLEVRDSNGGLIAFENDWQDNTPTAVKAPCFSRRIAANRPSFSSLPRATTPQSCAERMERRVSRWIEAYRLQ
jgi:hypothetical protein